MSEFRRAGGRSPQRPLRTRTDWRGKWDRLVADSTREVRPETLPFPTDSQKDLLKAALLPADQAGPAWRRWKARGLRLQTVEDASFRLFGRLWANRDAAGIEPEDLGLLKGVYRQSFADNVAKLTAALNATKILVDAGVPLLFFKGAALIATCDETLGLRRIADVDVLVAEREAGRAAALLTAAGCSATYDTAHGHSWHCTTPEGYSIDLHWWAFKPAGDDSAIFETARETELLGRRVLVPSAAESLVVTIANAFWINGAPLRWIADSLLLFRNGPIDWNTVLQRAHRPGLIPGLTAGLDYLAREFGAPVPASVLDDLRRRPITWQARSAHWAVTHGILPELTQLEVRRAQRLHRGRTDRNAVVQTARLAVRSSAVLAIRGASGLSQRANSGS